MPMPKELDALVQDYRINLLCPHEMSNDGIRKFRTGLAPLLYMLKHDDDEEQLLHGIATEPMFRQLDKPTRSVIRQLTKYDLESDILEMSCLEEVNGLHQGVWRRSQGGMVSRDFYDFIVFSLIHSRNMNIVQWY